MVQILCVPFAIDCVFKHQVVICNKDMYVQQQDISLVANKYITEDFLHKCDTCEVPCK